MPRPVHLVCLSTLLVTVLMAMPCALQAQAALWTHRTTGGWGDPSVSFGPDCLVSGPMAVDAQGNTALATAYETGIDDGALTVKYGADGAVLWRAAFAAGRGGRVHAVAMTASGDVVVAGYASEPDGGLDYLTIRYDGQTGAALWTARYDGPDLLANDDRATAIAIDGNGDVIVTGNSRGTVSLEDYVTVKYAGGSGQQLWATRREHLGRDNACAIALDAQGNPVVTGSSAGNGGNLHYATIKYSGVDGSVQWTALSAAGNWAEATALAVAPNGDVLVTGNAEATVDDFAMTTVRYAGSDGTALWTSRQPDPQLSSAYHIAADSQGNALVTGSIGGVADPQAFDRLTLKLAASSGIPLWQSRQPHVAGQDTGSSELSVDAQDNIVVAGSVRENQRGMLRASKLAGSTGAPLWTRDYPSQDSVYSMAITHDGQGGLRLAATATQPDSDQDELLLKLDAQTGDLAWTASEGVLDGLAEFAAAAAVDNQGNTLLAGSAYHGVAAGYDWAVHKIGPDGVRVWRVRLALSTGGGDGARAVVADSAGNVVVTGVGTASDGQAEFLTVKLAAASGAELWRARYRRAFASSGGVPEGAMFVQLDASGDVLVSGAAAGSDGASGDMVTLKYAGASGQQLWLARHDSAAGVDDQPRALAVAADGSVVVAGSCQSNACTLQYRGSDGERQWLRNDSVPSGVRALAVDPAGNVLVAGEVQLGKSDIDIVTVKYAAASGNLLWAALSNKPDAESARSIAVDVAGDVVVSGDIEDDLHSDLITLKYAGGTGTELWNTRSDGGGARHNVASTVLVDAAGNVLVSAHSDDPALQSTCLIQLYDRSSGNLLSQWRTAFDSAPSGFSDLPDRLLLAPDGSLRLTGNTQKSVGPRMAVLKFAAPIADQWFASGFE